MLGTQSMKRSITSTPCPFPSSAPPFSWLRNAPVEITWWNLTSVQPRQNQTHSQRCVWIMLQIKKVTESYLECRVVKQRRSIKLGVRHISEGLLHILIWPFPISNWMTSLASIAWGRGLVKAILFVYMDAFRASVCVCVCLYYPAY